MPIADVAMCHSASGALLKYLNATVMGTNTGMNCPHIAVFRTANRANRWGHLEKPLCLHLKEVEMSDEMKVVPILPDGKYVIEIPAGYDVEPKSIAEAIDVLMEGDVGFLILSPGLKLVRVDKDDIQKT